MINTKDNIPINTYVRFPHPKPLGKNSVQKLSVLYEDRKYYSEFILPYIERYLGDSGIFIDLTRENALYGLVDEKLNISYPSEEYMDGLPSVGYEQKKAMDFVVAAFVDLKKMISTASMKGKVPRESVFYDLKAHSAYENPEASIQVEKNKLIDGFKSFSSSDANVSSKIVDAKSFNKIFLQYLRESIRRGRAVTKSTTLISKSFANLSSGLIIDVATEPNCDNDKTKFDKYFSDRGFSAFADSCKRTGFAIDLGTPWRIVADLSSPAMKEAKVGNHVGYMSRYGLSDIDDLFRKRYIKVLEEELLHMRDLFYDCYKSLVTDYPYYEVDYNKLLSCDFSKQTKFERKMLTRENFSSAFDNTYWNRVYILLRSMEENRPLSQQEFENIVRESNNYIRAGHILSALQYVNGIFAGQHNVQYFSSLQDEKAVLQQRAQRVLLNNLIF